ncbi:protein-tyrosine phosphatase-like protein [Hygrophoropsis aurantiaca]|uniref:Protein-tyrosine phosphatase-like protein n=1 Tax=Hygrophoropsis aurantiaca TaxID=72124 RepID=A0ACB8ATU6_9AGAM|nr:protein-tyrosine phosphatase-like protein [Hygrophoropsis aurantiaca]
MYGAFCSDEASLESYSDALRYHWGREILAKREKSRKRARDNSLQEANATTRNPTTGKSQSDAHYSVLAGYHPDHYYANRYSDIAPYDRTRVIVGQGRYLNASWVRELYGGKLWIATQAPLPPTAHTFLSALMQPLATSSDSRTSSGRVRTVVQLTQNFESGRQKAHAYFPSVPGQSMVAPPEPGCNAPPLKVTLIESHIITDSQCLQSKISIHPISSPNGRHEEPVVFTHMLYGAWPDHGVPQSEDQASLLSFTRLVDRVNRNGVVDQDPDPPIMVNCSAGVGRTGAFIALSSLLRAYLLLSESTLPLPSDPTPPFSLPPSPLGCIPNEQQNDLVVQEIDALREQRPGMVQQEEQARLIYSILIQAFTDVAP